MTANKNKEYLISYERDNYQCVYPSCGKRATQQGHCLDNTITNRKVYGKEVIENHNNLRSVCGLEHNTKIRVLKKNNKDKFASLIKENLDKILSVEYINNYIKE